MNRKTILQDTIAVFGGVDFTLLMTWLIWAMPRYSKTCLIWPTAAPHGIGGNCPSALPWAFLAPGFFMVCTNSLCGD